ncbi:putative phosphoserine phosphatase 2 [Clostridium tepidiprofundi DSM 19306]|uniref:Putative phosphoserine phosphatase 2 n=1 Tax=Clostridium tepidiprofundi DSM 19306 TaxID=1121338 RepID=A0A151B2R8_9CLOT|nr:histidine phosphatase family protein [Clostridium tepidiprofundi]KYH34062.1 putative phosphoserine phosphatase 2 [Clostridium tepidiprofundi DSM 19306]
MNIYLVRHGKDDDRYRGGWSELDLIPEGKEQAKKLAEFLYLKQKEFNITKIISSDLTRAFSTANEVVKKLDIRVEVDKDLREMNNGDLAGMLNKEALVKYPGLFFNTLRMDEKYPNGESPDDFYKRVKKRFDDLICKYKESNENILIVTHGGVINIIYHIVKDIEWTNKNKAFKASNVAIHKLNCEGKLEFEIENYYDFLK